MHVIYNKLAEDDSNDGTHEINEPRTGNSLPTKTLIARIKNSQP